ncbi:DUF4129 domain-containing protein [Jeotgalibacillus sp. HH7-29]|uniref:DUF4129 domain-containing protein n=2 Tax=Jeotgalibacillus haloalkalitolerans TaxID=3104292 RepID=A0ABU5KPC5_9BACL|nr:DUF4129 domain-containing protein [Jeotgalibacillus sp. HH7-29]
MILTVIAAGGIFPIHYAALLYGSGLFILALFIRNIRQAGTLLIVFGSLLALFFSGWSALPVIALGIFLFWRLLARSYHQDTQDITTVQLILLMIVFISVYNFQLTYEVYPPGLVILSLIGGFMLYSAAPYFSSYTGTKALKLYTKWSGLFLASAIILYLLISPFRLLLIEGVNLMISWVTLLLYQTGIDIDVPEIVLEEAEPSEGGDLFSPNPFGVTEIEQTVRVGTVELVALIAGLLVLTLFTWKIVKKFRGPLQYKQNNQSGMVIRRKDADQPASLKMAVPNHVIRKEMLKLEKKAQKKDAGRRKSETVREWFTRLNVQHAQDFAVIYEKIRYAGKELTESEYKAFEQFVKDFEKRVNNF